jgi:hypothetical protein
LTRSRAHAAHARARPDEIVKLQGTLEIKERGFQREKAEYERKMEVLQKSQASLSGHLTTVATQASKLRECVPRACVMVARGLTRAVPCPGVSTR